jgi:DNA-binding NtrC family response regulator
VSAQARQPLVAPPTVLLVEDKQSLRTMLRHAIEAAGHCVIEARDEPEAVAVLRQGHPDLVLSDLRLPVGDGLGVLHAARDLDPELPVIVMTAYGSIQDAVSAMKQGALDFLAKPVDPDHLMLLIERALAQRRIVAENILMKEELASRRGAPQIVGDDPGLKRVMAALHRAAAAGTTVLIQGESGTGKELVARALHALSPRAAGPFVAINCAAIPDNLLESELFGYEKGAFTGAVARKPGRFELAHRGTLFLDEVGDLPLGLQPKILRAIENRCFERVGGNAVINVDVRLVAASNKNLRALVATRLFREDLFFRLSVFPVTVPPLRDRPGDIPILARHFVERYGKEAARPALTLSPSAMQALTAHRWPGNVRELQNCMERAVLLSDGDTIYPTHFNLPGPDLASTTAEKGPWDVIDLSGPLAEVTRRVSAEAERRKIQQVLRETNGDRVRAAAVLEISPAALLAKLALHGIE